MNNYLILASIAALALPARAALVFPNDFSARFAGEDPLTGWTVHSTDAVPTGPYADRFADGPTTVMTLDGEPYIFTCNQYEDAVPSDNWLVSPEFTVTDDQMVLSFGLVLTGSNDRCSYDVLYSETGTAKEDFTGTVENGSIQGRGADVVSQSKRFMLTGLKDKKIRLAFVNRGNTTGIMGVADFNVMPWYCSVENIAQYDSYILEDGLSMTIKASTPTVARGYTAVLETESGYHQEIVNEMQNFKLASLSTVRLNFDGEIPMKAQSEKFTLTFTPNFDGVIPAVVEGTLVRADRTFPAVAVVEEITGTWCGNCPRGIAFMNMWTHTIKNAEGDPRVLGIALHIDNDPMAFSDGVYYSDIQAQIRAAGASYPGAPYMLVDRTKGADPLEVDMDAILARNSYARADIAEVVYNPAVSRDVTVKYNYTTSLTSSNPGFNVCAAVIENDVTGSGSGYNQTNYYRQYTVEAVREQLGEAIVPYFEPFLEKEQDFVPAADMHYNDVLRGYFPSYGGMPIEGAVEANVANDGTITFEMPETLKNEANAAVILMLIKQGSGEIIGADMMKAADFQPESGVSGVDGDVALSLQAVPGGVLVNSDAEAIVSVYALDGAKLSESAAAPGTVLPIAYRGPVIVRAISAAGAASIKLIP